MISEARQLIVVVFAVAHVLLNTKRVAAGNDSVPIQINQDAVSRRDVMGRHNDHSASGFRWCRQRPGCSQ